jgi:hypothetical protein
MLTATTTTLDAAVASLGENLKALSHKDQDFACQLLAEYSRKGGNVTDKQGYWLGQMALRATRPAAKPVTTTLTDAAGFAGIAALFATAGKALKRPAVTLAVDGGAVRLSVAGPTARVPGSVNVVQRGGVDIWLGRVLGNGRFEPSRKTPPSVAQGALLAAFAADPAGVAADYGKASGRCCFCSKELTDARSLAVGYGNTCASHYSLPWGAK